MPRAVLLARGDKDHLLSKKGWQAFWRSTLCVSVVRGTKVRCMPAKRSILCVASPHSHQRIDILLTLLTGYENKTAPTNGAVAIYFSVSTWNKTSGGTPIRYAWRMALYGKRLLPLKNEL